MTTKISQTTTNSSQKPKIKPAHDVVIEQAFELESLHAEVKRLGQELAEVKQERDRYNQEINSLCKDRLDGWMSSAFDQVARSLGFETATNLQTEIELLWQEFRQKTAEGDKLRADIAGLLNELTGERQQRIEANAYVLATARALGLGDSEVDELPQKVASLKWDYDEAMLQYDMAQKRACEAEAQIEILRKNHDAQLTLEIGRQNELRKACQKAEKRAVEAESHAYLWHRLNNEASSHAQEWQRRANEAEAKLVRALEHIKSLDAQITLEVQRQDELREAYREVQDAIRWLWGFWDGNTLVASSGANREALDEAWDRLLQVLEQLRISGRIRSD